MYNKDFRELNEDNCLLASPVGCVAYSFVRGLERVGVSPTLLGGST